MFSLMGVLEMGGLEMKRGVGTHGPSGLDGFCRHANFVLARGFLKFVCFLFVF